MAPLKIEARLRAHRSHPCTPVRIQKFPHTPFTMVPFNPFTRRSLKSGRRETLELDIPKRLNGVTAGYRKLGLPHRKDNKITSTAF